MDNRDIKVQREIDEISSRIADLEWEIKQLKKTRYTLTRTKSDTHGRERRNLVVDLRRSGMTFRAIGEQLNISSGRARDIYQAELSWRRHPLRKHLYPDTP